MKTHQGTLDAQLATKTRRISKRGSPHLRASLFLVCNAILKQGNAENPIYCFMDKKRAEGKRYYAYMVAGAAKFLRIYCAKVKERLAMMEYSC